MASLRPKGTLAAAGWPHEPKGQPLARHKRFLPDFERDPKQEFGLGEPNPFKSLSIAPTAASGRHLVKAGSIMESGRIHRLVYCSAATSPECRRLPLGIGGIVPLMERKIKARRLYRETPLGGDRPGVDPPPGISLRRCLPWIHRVSPH